MRFGVSVFAKNDGSFTDFSQVSGFFVFSGFAKEVTPCICVRCVSH